MISASWSGVDLDHVERPGGAAARRRVEQDDGVVALGDREREVHPADAEVDDLDPGRELPPREPVRERDAEAVIAEEHVADSGDEDPSLGDRRPAVGRWPSQHLKLVRREEEPVPGLPRQPKIAARVVVEHDGNRRAPLDILFDRLDDGPLTGERDVEHVSAGVRVQPHARAGAEFSVRRADRVRTRTFQLLPVGAIGAHRVIPNSRIVPCSAISCSGVSASVRSRISRVRGSDARISAFSSSLRARMLRTSI